MINIYNIYLVIILNLRIFVHDTVMRTAIIFALLSILVGHILGDNVNSQHIQFTSSFGLLVINLFLAFITIYVGSHTICDDLTNNTISTLISKKFARGQILLAKFLAILLMNIFNILLMFILFTIFILFSSEFIYQYWIAIYIIFIELILLSSIVLWLNTFTRSIVCFYSTAALYIVGHFSDILINLEQITDLNIVKQLAKFIFYLVPNFSIFSTSHFIVSSASISTELLVPGTIYCGIYSLILLVAGYWSFASRNL